MFRNNSAMLKINPVPRETLFTSINTIIVYTIHLHLYLLRSGSFNHLNPCQVKMAGHVNFSPQEVTMFVSR